MSFAGFKMTGPDCCCCRDVITMSSGQLRLKGEVFEFPPGAFGVVVLRDIDHQNKISVAIQSATRLYTRTIEDLVDVELINDPSRLLLRATMDRVNQYIFYDQVVGANWELWRIDYDGTNDTFVCTMPQWPIAGITMVYSRTNDAIYYLNEHRDMAGDRYYEIRRVNADGTGDTLIYRSTNPHDSGALGDTIHRVDVDNVNERLFFLEQIADPPIGPAAQPQKASRIYTCDLDGAGLTMLVELLRSSTTPSGATINDLQWSHKDQKIYTFEKNNNVAVPTNDPFGGFFSYLDDGTDRTQLWRRNVAEGQHPEPAGTSFLWCGFEKTGDSTEA